MSLDQRNAELEKKLEANPIDEQIAVLVMQAKRNKNNIRLLAISLFVQLFLTCALGYLGFITFRIAREAESNRNAIVSRCEATNEGRARNKELWDYLLGVPPTEPRTPQEQAALDGFAQKVDQTFAPSDCSKIVK